MNHKEAVRRLLEGLEGAGVVLLERDKGALELVIVRFVHDLREADRGTPAVNISYHG